MNFYKMVANYVRVTNNMYISINRCFSGSSGELFFAKFNIYLSNTANAHAHIYRLLEFVEKTNACLI